MSFTADVRRTGSLTPGDVEQLERSGISLATIHQGKLQRVDSFTGGAIVGRNGSGDYAGIVFPYIWPGEDHPRGNRLRRDKPEIENGKPKGKYLGEPERKPMLYFVPGTDPRWLCDRKLPILFVEGEKKTLACSELSWHSVSDAADRPHYLAIGLAGVWAFRGRIGKVEGPDGQRLDEKGLLPDFSRIELAHRDVCIFLDSNVHTKDEVRIARYSFAKELRSRDARVRFIDMPAEAGVNGPDDLIGAWGKDRVLDLILNHSYDPKASKKSGDAKREVPPETNDLITATELYEGKFVALRMLLDSVLWAGLTMLVAKPKAGKSWLTLQMAIQLAGGKAVEGVTALETGPVLYVALEEPPARTAARLRMIAPPGSWTANLHCRYDLLPLMGGGAEQIESDIKRIQPVAVFVDTFTAAVKTASKNGSDVFRSQYAEVSRLRKIAEENNIAVVVVHHARKGIADDAIEAVAGTGGIAAAVDTVWQLKRKPEGEATLDIVGRETEERTLALRFHQEPSGWSVLGDDAMQLLNAERRQVLELLREDGGLTPAQIAAELGKSRPAIRMLLKRMRDDGQISKQNAKYFPTHSVSYSVTEREKE